MENQVQIPSPQTQKVYIAPSVLAADFGRLNDVVLELNQSVAHWIHCDIMDGVYVPNISFGLPVLSAIKKAAKLPLDVHLMIMQPEKYISAFRDAGADILTIHPDATIHLHRTLDAIRSAGMRAGVALNPATPIEALSDVLELIDVICVMSVNPGFGGQKFIAHTYDKVSRLKNLIEANQVPCLIEVDGGVNTDNAEKLVACGADVLVAGNSVFAQPNLKTAIEKLHWAANRHRI